MRPLSYGLGFRGGPFFRLLCLRYGLRLHDTNTTILVVPTHTGDPTYSLHCSLFQGLPCLDPKYLKMVEQELPTVETLYLYTVLYTCMHAYIHTCIHTYNKICSKKTHRMESGLRPPARDATCGCSAHSRAHANQCELTAARFLFLRTPRWLSSTSSRRDSTTQNPKLLHISGP